jgi:hypothetical protein
MEAEEINARATGARRAALAVSYGERRWTRSAVVRPNKSQVGSG